MMTRREPGIDLLIATVLAITCLAAAFGAFTLLAVGLGWIR